MSERLLPDGDTMYRALVEKDPTFHGLFYTGVTTTGVFCRTICTARKPWRENVVFFPTTREALLAGYRLCRVCRPAGAARALHCTPSARMIGCVKEQASLRLSLPGGRLLGPPRSPGTASNVSETTL